MRRNPSLTTWLLLGAGGYLAWRLWLRPKMAGLPRPAAPRPAPPRAAVRYRWQSFDKGKDRVCYDTQKKKYVDDVNCEALELEGY